LNPRSGAGEAKQRPARLLINRSPHPSTETGQLHRPNGIYLLRWAVAIVYVWFGGLKL